MDSLFKILITIGLLCTFGAIVLSLIGFSGGYNKSDKLERRMQRIVYLLLALAIVCIFSLFIKEIIWKM